MTWVGLAVFVVGCAGPPPRDRPALTPSAPIGRSEHVAAEPTEDTVPTSGAAEQPGTEDAPREVALPAPAVWVEAFTFGDQCAGVWFDETRRATWSVSEPAHDGGPAGEVDETDGSFHSYRDDAYRRQPGGVAVSCTVGARGDLGCRYDACTDLVQTQPPLRCRVGARPRPRPRAQSSVQRTHSFVLNRPWWRSGLLDGGLRHVCVRRDDAILCYALEPDVARPAPLSTPALSALRDVRDLSGAGSAACTVLGDGSVYCWGTPLTAEPTTEESSTDAEPTDPASPWTPRRIEGIPPAVQVSVGLRNACARTVDGRVFCWGDPRCLVDEVHAEETVGDDAPTR